MTKEEVLNELRMAKSAHIGWVQRAKLVISGFTIEENAIPVNSTECKFGKWFYADGQRLNYIRNNPVECLEEIEQFHFKLHDMYVNIYKIYYEHGKVGFFSKMFGTKRKVTDEDELRAKEYYYKLEDISKELIKLLNTLERRIIAVSDKEIELI